MTIECPCSDHSVLFFMPITFLKRSEWVNDSPWQHSLRLRLLLCWSSIREKWAIGRTMDALSFPGFRAVCVRVNAGRQTKHYGWEVVSYCKPSFQFKTFRWMWWQQTVCINNRHSPATVCYSLFLFRFASFLYFIRQSNSKAHRLLSTLKSVRKKKPHS